MKKKITALFYLLSTVYSFAQYTGPTYLDVDNSLWPVDKKASWGPYNTHDPSVLRDGDYYYMYSTDVMVGYSSPQIAGLQIRKSKDLVNWEFVGFAFSGVPQEAKNHLALSGKTSDAVWAPYILKSGSQYRLYWCVSAFGTKVSYIGLATSSSPTGPWAQQGCIVKTDANETMNAIDPTVVTGKDGKQWMAYGSYFDGIYMKELEPLTGLAITLNDKGTRIIRRAAGKLVEGAEIIYNAQEDKYYIFFSYDNLVDAYNVRVGRSSSPTGPYLDINGVDLELQTDNYPMLLSPYKFAGHLGWQGTGHCSVINDNGQFYMTHQGHPVQDPNWADAHVRKMQWLNGWPVVSPERHGGLPISGAPDAKYIPGTWAHMVLGYKDPFALNTASNIVLNANGLIDNNAVNSWSYSNGALTLNWNNGQYIDNVRVWYEWDWENKRVCMVYSGFGFGNVGVWGKSANTGTVVLLSIAVSPAVKTLLPGETLQLTTTFAPADATNKNISYSSYNKFVATVSETGLVTAIKSGASTITVTSQDGNKKVYSEITVADTTTTAIEDEIGLKNNITVLQNYPNPFKTTTNLSFNLKVRTKIKITLNNIVGGYVDLISNESFDPGDHTIQYTNDRLESGVYAYVVETDKQKFVKRLIVK